MSHQFCKGFICLKGKVIEKGEAEKDGSFLCCFSLQMTAMLGLGWPGARAWYSIQVSDMSEEGPTPWVIFCFFPKYISMEFS